MQLICNCIVWLATVLDPARVPIAGARVSAGPGLEAVTDARGVAVLRLEPGCYTIQASAEGFRAAVRSVDVRAGGAVELVLEIEGIRETVTVSESVGVQASTKTQTPVRDIPQSLTAIRAVQMQDQMMLSLGDALRYVPGVTVHQGENNRDQVILRGNNSSADFFVNGVRDDVQYFRDLYNLERVEVLKGPNALMFGRGGAGGVINRVTKEAGFTPAGELRLSGGGFGHRRVAADYGRPLGNRLAARLNAMAEDSGSFRDGAGLRRHGLAPAVSITATERTRVTLSYENFHDRRTADRGIPSFQGRPSPVEPAVFFGVPEDSRVRAGVNLGAALVEHQAGRLNVRNRAQVGDYDKAYRNYVPGAVSADGALVSLSAYNNATVRRNIFNQTDATWSVAAGPIRHLLLMGAEAGRQTTDNLRKTGYFGAASSVTTPLASPRPPAAAFRPSTTDADNHVEAGVGAVYVQDQIDLGRHVHVTAGVRFDRFDLRYRNHRTGERLRRVDRLVSPRAGVVFKPSPPVSIYGSYSVSYLPSAGDQFSSLTTVTQQVKPEKFSNLEAGVKWDLARGLAFTTALYRLDRTNTRSTDPNDPARIVQTGSQRANGFEVGLSGKLARHWSASGGYACQDAFITSSTTAARAGAQVAQAPHHSLSLWNNFQLSRGLGAGLGILSRADMFAAVDNTVILPRYTRADAALFWNLTERLRLQANLENLTGRRYFLNADGNNNISPGWPRTARVGLTARF